jgi:hypothetical protein
MTVCVRQDDSGAVVVTNLTAIPVKSPEEIFDILGRSFRRRATSETLMNQFSSRSHSIFTVNVRAHAPREPGLREMQQPAQARVTCYLLLRTCAGGR